MPGHHSQSRLEGEHPYGDLGQLILLILFLGIWIADSFFLRWTTFLTTIIPIYIRLPIAALIFLSAAYSAKKSHDMVFGGDTLPDGILDTGIYSRLRHPMYCGALQLYKGLCISTLSLASAGLLLFIFIFYDYIARHEEKVLLEKYGTAYEAYAKRVPRWIPRLK